MEKKQYIQPEMKSYDLKPASVIATSNQEFSYGTQGNPYDTGR